MKPEEQLMIPKHWLCFHPICEISQEIKMKVEQSAGDGSLMYKVLCGP